jgi:hypothetical protein
VTALALTHPAPVIMRTRELVGPCRPRHLAGFPHRVQLASPYRYFYSFRSPLTTSDLAKKYALFTRVFLDGVPVVGVCVAAERKTGKLDFDVGRPDALETRIEVSGCPFLDIERL